MVATSLLDNKLKLSKLISALKKDFPNINFVESNTTLFSFERSEIQYAIKPSYQKTAMSIFHELGHFIAEHKKYDLDIELLNMELEAWVIAKKLAKKHSVIFSQKHLDSCMDSYRDWIHKRSTCPNCKQQANQISFSAYKCLNCFEKWSITRSRFCRSYRKKLHPKNT